MISTLYKPFQHWSEGGSVYILSDLHFEDPTCIKMDPYWPLPDDQVQIINSKVQKGDTFVCLGDVGNRRYIDQIKAHYKILILGNHDCRGDYRGCFDEIYSGPLFVAEKILLSHEPIMGLPWCLNIHGHDHNGSENYPDDCKHLNLAANVCGYTPVNLGALIKQGILANIPSLHQMTIDRATAKKQRILSDN